MLTKKNQAKHFNTYKENYRNMLIGFFENSDNPETFLNEGYKVGRKAVVDNIGLLNVTSIHHDILIEYLHHLKTNNHVEVAKKGSVFFEEVLAPFEMVTMEFREAIKLLNRHSIEFATQIHELKDEISIRKTAEEGLQVSREKYRFLSEQLQKSLKEKEALLKEIYHRVKNNLQVITSLINLQLDSVDNVESRQALIESVTRIKTMALVHEMLYQSNNLSEIKLNNYIELLINNLYEIYNVSHKTIKFQLQFDDVVLSIDKAITLGLIINEIVSNSFKHAFPGNQPGEIHCSLKKTNNKIILTISDNGIGIPDQFDPTTAQTLGMRLIMNLTKQLQATIQLSKNKGTTFTLVI